MYKSNLINSGINQMKYCVFALLITCNVSAESIKDMTFGTLKVSEVTSIYDGDTFRANLSNLHPLISKRIGIRVSGIDTPEMRGKCDKEKKLAREAKQFTVNFLRFSSDIELRNVKRGKYFRIVADVYGDNKSLTKALLSNGLGVPYSGNKKTKNWCE